MPVNDIPWLEPNDCHRHGMTVAKESTSTHRIASEQLSREFPHEQPCGGDSRANQPKTNLPVHDMIFLKDSSRSNATHGDEADEDFCSDASHVQNRSSKIASRSMPVHSRISSLSQTAVSDRQGSHKGSDAKTRGREPNHKQRVSKARKTKEPKVQRKVPETMQMRWRIGAAPSVALALSREDNQISQVISQAIAYYTSMSEVIWGPQVRKNTFFYDLDNRVEVLRDSTVAAASLVAADRLDSAQEVLNKVLPGIEDQLRNPHPALYVMMAELALNLVRTPGLALRREVKRYIAARAFVILGAEHPLTVLLRLDLPQARNEMLGEQLWNAILPILAKSFGSDHYQTSTQVYVAARNLASCGRIDEAVTRIQRIIDQWCKLYGNNSLIVCYSKIELANILASAGSDMKAEFVVSDALRTSDMIQAAELRNEDCNLSEKRHRESSIAFPRVAGLRTLGKLHSLRGNYGASAHYYSQAVATGIPSLGTESAAVELAQAELDSIRKLELQKSQHNFAAENLSGLTYIVASPII